MNTPLIGHQVPPAPAPRVKPLFPHQRVIYLALVLVAALAAEAVTSVQHVSDRARLAEVSLRHIEGMTHDLNALEVETLADQKFTLQRQFHKQDVDLHMRQELSTLRTLLPQDASQRQLFGAYSRYQQAEDVELRRVRQGNAKGASKIARTRVQPAFAELSGLIADILARNDTVALQANAYADTATTAIMLCAALLIGILFRRTSQANRAAAESAVRVAAQETLRESHHRFQALAANASDVIAILAADGIIHYVSPNAARLWGYDPETLFGTPISSLTRSEDGELLQALLTQAAGAVPEASLKAELRIRYAVGTVCLAEVVLTNLLDEPAVGGIVMTCRDITERKAFEAQLAHQAFHDVLTGLPNRALLMERLTHALSRASRTGTPVGLIFLDLDNFKVINDSLGHEAGDSLLITVAERLRACVRPGDTVARLGGDEFTVLLEDLNDEGQAPGLAERIVEVLRTPVNVGGRELFVTGSLGIAVSLDDARTPDDLLRDADTAMYQAKNRGKGQGVVFDLSMNLRAVERLELETDLRRALECAEFRVYYQPIMFLDSGKISEVEALVRWEHPERGLVPPAKFVPLAEETGLIVPLGDWVLAQSCRQAREWQNQYPTEPPLTVSVNLSARQLQQPDLVERVAAVLAETGLSAAHLKLEITESVMMQDADVTILMLHQLKALGVRLAVDDFGTGYSSMAYLSSLPIDTLKIDRSFVGKMGRHEQDEAIVRAIVNLAKTLKLHITSEGIETPDQLAQLQNLGCDRGQGFLFAEPLTSEDLGGLLATAWSQERPRVLSGADRLAA